MKKPFVPTLTREYLFKEYHNNKKSINKICEETKISSTKIKEHIKYYGIYPPRIINKRELEKKLLSKEEFWKRVAERRRKTCLEKYGVDNASKAQVVKDKTKETNRKKYGVDWIQQTNAFKEKRKQTCLKKFGATCNLVAPEQRKKIEEKWMEHYGVDNPTKCPEIKKKQEETLLKNYGVRCPMHSPALIQKIIDGKPEANKKANETRRKNHTFNSSKQEKETLKILETKFSNIETQYDKDPRYPYKCDFYIPELKLFIELNFFWTHGKEPYDANNPEHQEILKKWKEKAKISKFFRSAIYNWTKLDVIKFKLAEKLNYKAFYTKQQFLDWFSTLN